MGNMSQEILFNVLLQKRAELAEQSQLVADLGTVDAALAMLAPHIEVERIVPKPAPPIHPAGRGELTMLALNFLREASEPISTQDLNLKIMNARNLDTKDPALVNTMRERLHSSLRHQRKQRRVRSLKSADLKYSLWEIVR